LALPRAGAAAPRSAPCGAAEKQDPTLTLCVAQGVASAPLWDAESVSVVGMISASDFIFILRRLRSRRARP